MITAMPDDRAPALILWLGLALVLVLLAAAFCGGYATGRRQVRPVVAVTAETTYTHTSDTTTVTAVTYKPDPKAAKRIADLTAALDGTTKSLNDLLNYTGDLQAENRVLIDSVTYYRLAAVAKMLEVRYNRGALTATTLDGHAVGTWRGRAVGNRWQLYADGANGRPVLRQPRFPLCLGIEAALTGTTRADSLTPGAIASAHLTARHGGITGFAGAGWPLGGEPRIEAGLRAGWEW